MTTNLARKFKDFLPDRANDDVEEPGDCTCSRFWTNEIVALNDVVLAEKDCHRYGSLIQDVPLINKATSQKEWHLLRGIDELMQLTEDTFPASASCISPP